MDLTSERNYFLVRLNKYEVSKRNQGTGRIEIRGYFEDNDEMFDVARTDGVHVRGQEQLATEDQ